MSKRPEPRIVALLPARNEGPRLAFCLRALARYADAIVYLDDCSEDDSVALAQSVAQECRVERILRKSTWHRDEPGDRNAMLEAGRALGGTHFVVLDADEAFTANCQTHDFLRQMICALRPGDRLAMTWIQLWRSLAQYRFDDSVWTWNTKEFAFCDQPRCRYASEFIHTPRVPQKLAGKTHALPGYQHGVLHFQFVNWANLLVKQAWYRCLERVREPGKSAASINERYAPSKDERGLRLQPAPAHWLAGYDFLPPDAFAAPDRWRVRQILGWFAQFGRERFADLDIWDVPWDLAEQGWTPAAPVASVSAPIPDLTAQLGEWRARVWELQAQRRWSALRDHCVHVLRQVSDDSEIILALGRAHAALGDLQAARWEFIKDRALHPKPEASLCRLAAEALRAKQAAEFNVRFGQVMESSSEAAEELRALAPLCLRRLRFLKAARLYCKSSGA